MNKLLISGVMLLMAAPALADLSNDELKEKGYIGSAELGYSSSSGNVDESSLNAKAGLEFMFGQWRHKAAAEAKYAEDEDSTIAERYFGTYQAERYFTEASYAFGTTSYENDRFNALEDLVTLVAGYGHNFALMKDMELATEIGPGYRWNNYGEGSDEWIVRGKLDFKWKVNTHFDVSSVLTVDSGEDNTITRSESALTSKMVADLAMKLSYTITNQSQPSEGFENTDRVAAITLLYSF